MKKKQFFYGITLFGLALFCQMVIAIFTIEGDFPLLQKQNNVKLSYIALWLCTVGVMFGRNIYLLIQKRKKQQGGSYGMHYSWFCLGCLLICFYIVEIFSPH